MYNIGIYWLENFYYVGVYIVEGDNNVCFFLFLIICLFNSMFSLFIICKVIVKLI